MSPEELMSTLKIRYQDSVGNAKKKKGEEAKIHTLTIPDVVKQYEKQDGKCAELGIAMTSVSKKNGRRISSNRWSSLSIDRLDCNKGYAPDNIRLTCWAVNCMRGTLSEDEARDQMFEFKEMLIN